MLAQLYSSIAGQKFFDELRTQQQLGYIVAQQPSKNTSRRIELLYLVQSKSVSPWECTKRMLDFISGSKAFFADEKQFTQENFATYKTALVEQLEENAKKLAGEFEA